MSDRVLRTNLQNRKMWPILRDIARQIQWRVNGSLVLMREEDWKDVLSSALGKARLAEGVDGGFVRLGAKTSEMSVAELRDLIDLAYAFGNERGVKWSDPEMESLMASEAA